MSRRLNALTHEFVDLIPERVTDGVLYICLPYATAVHRCCCGCGIEVTTPLSPTDWKLTFDGEHVSLYPSVGNWNFPCRSHYWIRDGCVTWAGDMTDTQIALARAHDRAAKARYYQQDRKADAPAMTNESKKTAVSRF